VRIGVELFHLIDGETGGLVPLIQGVLDALFTGWPEHEVVLFGTPANEGLLPALPARIHRLTLPATGNFFPLLDAQASLLCLDVLVCTYPFEFELTFPRARQVVVIPDIQHEYFPDFFAPETLRGRRASFAKVLRGSGAIATISEHARQTLLNHPEARCRDVFIMSPALRTEWDHPSLDNLTQAERALVPTGDFFLYPANLWPHKNHRRLFEAFALFLERAGRPLELMLTGHPHGWPELARAFPGLPVRHLGFVRPSLLRVLLARANALTFFSLFEGFGIPLLEAFAVGTPVVCSNTTSLPEIGGDAVAMCDPTDPVAMSETLLRVFTDQGLRDRLVARGRERLALFNWRTSATRLVDACARICQRGPVAVEIPLVPLQRLNQLVQEIDADRGAKQVIIRDLDAACKARLAVIQRLDRINKAQLDTIQQLKATLPFWRKVLGRHTRHEGTR
jgi:glycosyltransferase involved in cell wall biosynthesis